MLEHSLDNEELQRWYRDRGFGGRVGFGSRPAVVVVDVANLWLDPENPLGSEQDSTLFTIARLLALARETNTPIIFTTMGYQPNLSDAGEIFLSKLPCTRLQVLGSRGTELHPALDRRDDEILIVKKRQSAFFDTPLLSHLIDKNIDTVIVVGLSTSGCIRSTCESAFNYNLRVIVPREAVGDRCRSAHEASLFDIDNRFADVTSIEEVLKYLSNLRSKVSAEAV